MLQLDQVTRILPGAPARVLFEGLALRVEAGECVAIVGESGSGKSTLLNCIAGLEAIDGGTIRVGDTPIERLDDDAMARMRRSHFGFVFQAFHILPHLDLLQNVALPLWLLGTAEAEAARRAREMLGHVGLGARATDPPQQLSGGELQRVAIARALVHRPHLVLADEPTGNLDPGRASEVLDLLLGQIRDRRAAGVMVTHSRSAAARADRVLELRVDGLHDVTERT
ncbi:ABC transporter ATP-binding protein [Thauera phenylacetica]|uniref:ABC transporter ATP-binding protein n=1 Tax=Thauera phenylacetica TaxID=164400 RepID=UPI0039E5C7B3